MHRMLALLTLLALVAACGGPEPTEDTDDSPADSGETVYTPECSSPGTTVCDNDAAMIRGTIRVDPELAATHDLSGELHIALTHMRLGQTSTGGFSHAVTRESDFDLAEGPVPFELDMCAGGVMWSEENCEYNLFVVLDRDGDNDIGNHVPGEDELVARHLGFELSCTGDSPCLDMVLDCVGPECVQFDAAQTCECAPESCGSAFEICS